MSKTSTENLLSAYRSLALPEQQTLQLLAFFAAPVARSPLVALLALLRVRFVESRAINAKDLVEFFNKTRSLGLTTERFGNFTCQRELQFPLIRQCQLEGRFKDFSSLVDRQFSSDYYRSQEHALQLLRLGFFMHSPDRATTALSVLRRYYSHDASVIASIFPEPLDIDWVTSLPQILLTAMINALLVQSISKLMPTSIFAILDKLKANAQLTPDLQFSYPVYLLLQGKVQELKQALNEPEMAQYQGQMGMLALMQGKVDLAITCFDQELTALKKQTGKRKTVLPGILGLLHGIALIAGGLPQQLNQAIELATIGLKRDEYADKGSYLFLLLTAETRGGNIKSAATLKELCGQTHELLPVSQLIRSLAAHWQNLPVPQEQLKSLRHFALKARGAGLLWLAAQLYLTAKTIDPVGTDNANWAEKLSEQLQLSNLAEIALDDRQDWERSLKALQELGASGKSPQANNTAAKSSRLAWVISDQIHSLTIQPVEQKQTARGWSNGRNVALKRLADEPDKLDFLTRQDLDAAASIRKERSYGYYSQTSYSITTLKALKALVEHPLLFTEDGAPLSLCRGTIVLQIKKGKSGLKLQLVPNPAQNEATFYLWESDTRLVLYELTQEQLRISSIIGNGLQLPLKAEQQLTSAVTAVAPHLLIQSDLTTINQDAETVEVDCRLRILLRPSGSGIRAELRISPFGDRGPLFLAAQGGSTVIAELEGQKLQCQRNLKLEKQRYQQLMDICSTFDLYDREHDSWRIETPEGTLDLLEELQSAMQTAPDAFVLQWPEGEQFKLKDTIAWDRLKLQVSSGKEWFSLDGTVSINDEQVLSLQRLLELSSNQRGRYIQLAEGEFIALTDGFRRKLDDLQRLMNRHGKEQRIHNLSAPLLEEALSGAASLKGDTVWKKSLERFHEAQALRPVLPSTMQVELRDYQLDGFSWLCRLAHWGVGACLADDMGLGKTVQALALLLTRAPDGPSLVLAPTSVCLNWESEARRFAPTLTPRLFGAGNREKFIASLQPFDLVICSYGLFQQEVELLTGIHWETAVLDEAQAIKNMTTKRSQAAMQLQAKFRIATTGTPVENRLDELWNLFRFLNPGLLGSHQNFSERFGNPIEQAGDKTARHLLKKLIRPFILRRTKSQVLEELPPRTDIVQRVELSGEEAAFYEALRRKALQTLDTASRQGPGERQIRILAEIMKLRRACCNPQLVMPDSGITSAKLTAFLEIVQELRENGHRALVFSQFVDHLSILRGSLDQQNISYQYLDGSTPQKERQQRVNAFQSGQGELFLISLKAGGTGLNLTAADYVIHVDPWWNPAVEDQASDRAHRIGQQRPVTVYRLVAANTIEEKIVALHSQKRELANSLLEGTESAGRVSAEDLLELLKEAG
ncbi:MAG: DEAD/DEAH box helicase [Geobacter sp.]|nr:DEAD/DEAH box helicase [Geobacter sp.]